jgi:predicted PurR-regulated permease PerM
MNNKNYSQQAIDIGIRMVLLFALLFWCFQIVSPFIMPVLWGIIIAIAVFPLQQLFTSKFKLGSKISAIFITVLLLAIILVPTALFFTSTTKTVLALKVQYDTYGFSMPEPPQFIYNLPIIGEKLHEFLDTFNSRLEEFIITYQSKLLAIGQSIMGAIIDTGLGIIQILVSIILSGVFLSIGDQKGISVEIFERLVGKNGHAYVQLIIQTIQSVVKGVLGVAVIQSLLIAIGVFITGIPHAPLWILLCLILSIVQVGPSLILLGISIYLFQTESTLYASIWSAYFVLAALSDNILKPFLLSKGSQVPMPIIFVGVVGGFLYSGFIGLFTGAIVLSIAYKLFQFWIQEDKVKQEIFDGGEY